MMGDPIATKSILIFELDGDNGNVYVDFLVETLKDFCFGPYAKQGQSKQLSKESVCLPFLFGQLQNKKGRWDATVVSDNLSTTAALDWSVLCPLNPG